MMPDHLHMLVPFLGLIFFILSVFILIGSAVACHLTGRCVSRPILF